LEDNVEGEEVFVGDAELVEAAEIVERRDC